MKQTMKKLITMITLALILVFASEAVTGITAYAVAATTANVKKGIKKMQADIKKLEKKYKKQAAKESKQKKGTTAVACTVICYDPLIVQDCFTKNVYWVEDSKNFNKVFGTGYLKTTGTYRTYSTNGYTYTCAVAKAVKVSSDSSKTKQKIEAYQATLKLYKNMLKDKVRFAEDEIYITEGSWNQELAYFLELGTGKYNLIKWESSNDLVAYVTYDNKIEIISPGTAVIKATTSISKKTTKLKVHVLPADKALNIGEVDVDGKSVDIPYSINDNHTVDSVIAISSDQSIIADSDINIEDSYISFYARKEGTVDITICVNYREVVTIPVTINGSADATESYEENYDY